jgi:O-antigen/teichoic acid export membrane protein
MAVLCVLYYYNSPIFIGVTKGNNKLVYSICLGILCIINLLTTITSSMLNGLKLYNTVIINSIILQLIIFIGVVILWAFCFTNFTNTSTVLFITIAAYCVIFIINCKAILAAATISNTGLKMSTAQLKAFFNYSFISFLCGVFQYLSYKSDFWVVHYYKGASALGVYSLAATLSQLLWIVPQSIATILFPYSGNIIKAQLGIIICTLGRVSLFIIVVVVIIAAALANYLIPLVYGTEYTEAVHLFIYFLIGIVPFTLVKIISSAFAGVGKVQYNLIGSLFSFVVGLIAYLILIPKYGLIGGVIGSNISYFLSTIIALYFFKKNYAIKYSDIFFIKMNDFKTIFLQLKKT